MTKTGDSTTRTRTELAYAKINLLLRILARDVSGYHSIETLFQRISLHDVVTVRVGAMERVLHCDGPTMPRGGLGSSSHNLAWRAAELYAQASGWETGWEITIDKQIPVGGGLGGGSADAAAVLRAMESMCPSPIGHEKLIALGGTLGADVAFFVSGESLAWAWGRGDRLLALPPLPTMPVLLVTFAEGVNTGAAYGAIAAQRSAVLAAAADARVSAHANARMFRLADFSSWPRVAAMAMNDFESVVPALHDGVAHVLPTLQTLARRERRSEPQGVADGALGGGGEGLPRIALLSGSGATCFLLAPDATSVRVPAEWHVTATHTT